MMQGNSRVVRVGKARPKSAKSWVWLTIGHGIILEQGRTLGVAQSTVRNANAGIRNNS